MLETSVERLTQYSEHDAEQLGRLMPFLSDSFTGEPVDAELLNTIITSPYHDQLVARLEGRIVGGATLSLVIGAAAGKKGYLEDFVTDPTVRGKGVGGKVWDEMLAWCREHEVSLDFTSRPSREAAHRFYHSHGAVVRETTVFHVDVE
jgi:GNAT superfamily N-acetyltransferase